MVSILNLTSNSKENGKYHFCIQTELVLLELSEVQIWKR